MAAPRRHRESRRRGGRGAVRASHASTAGARHDARSPVASDGPSAAVLPAAFPAAAGSAGDATGSGSASPAPPTAGPPGEPTGRSASRVSPVHLIPSHHRRTLGEPGSGYQPGDSGPDMADTIIRIGPPRRASGGRALSPWPPPGHLVHPLLRLGRDGGGGHRVRGRRVHDRRLPSTGNSSLFTRMGAPLVTARFTASLGRASTSRGPSGPRTTTQA